MIQKQTVSSFSGTENLTRQLRQSEKKAGITASRKKQTKKKLKYNSREISTLLLNANNSQVAASVLIMARSRLADVRSEAATGQYDKAEVMNAIRHADKMVNCAQRKMHNLKEEETEKQYHDKEKKSLSKANNKQKKSVTKQLLQLKRQQMELKRKSRKHRGEERSKIEEANHSYDIASGGTNQKLPVMNASERLILLEVKKLEMKEREEKEDSVKVENGSTDSTGAVVDISVSDETDAEASAYSVSIDISI